MKPEARSRKWDRKGKPKDNLPHTCLCQAWEVLLWLSPGTSSLTSFRVSFQSFLWHNRQWAHVIPGNPLAFPATSDFAVFLDNYFPPLALEKRSIPALMHTDATWPGVHYHHGLFKSEGSLPGSLVRLLLVSGWPCQWSKMQPAEHEGPQADGELSHSPPVSMNYWSTIHHMNILVNMFIQVCGVRRFLISKHMF